MLLRLQLLLSINIAVMVREIDTLDKPIHTRHLPEDLGDTSLILGSFPGSIS